MSKHQGYFKPGSQWTGNRNGRPKKIYSRDHFTDEIFIERKEDIREVTDTLFMEAKAQKPWAIKLVLEYFLTRPKSAEAEQDTASADRMIEKLTAIPSDKLEAIKKILIEEIEKSEKPS